MSADGSQPVAPPRLALFDLDGTLLAGDTDALWCAFLVEEGVLESDRFAGANRDVAERYARGAIEPAEFAAFYAATLAGLGPVQWWPLRDRFVSTIVAPRIGAAAYALVSRHRNAGDRLVLSTATNRFLTEPIAALLGIADLLATDLEQNAAGEFTGRLAGTVNMRDGKVIRMRQWLAAQGLGEPSLAAATFYSDSINDLPLLCAVGSAVVVDPDPRLRDEAARRRWPVISLLG